MQVDTTIWTNLTEYLSKNKDTSSQYEYFNRVDMNTSVKVDKLDPNRVLFSLKEVSSLSEGHYSRAELVSSRGKCIGATEEQLLWFVPIHYSFKLDLLWLSSISLHLFFTKGRYSPLNFNIFFEKKDFNF